MPRKSAHSFIQSKPTKYNYLNLYILSGPIFFHTIQLLLVSGTPECSFKRRFQRPTFSCSPGLNCARSFGKLTDVTQGLVVATEPGSVGTLEGHHCCFVQCPLLLCPGDVPTVENSWERLEVETSTSNFYHKEISFSPHPAVSISTSCCSYLHYFPTL